MTKNDTKLGIGLKNDFFPLGLTLFVRIIMYFNHYLEMLRNNPANYSPRPIICAKIRILAMRSAPFVDIRTCKIDPTSNPLAWLVHLKIFFICQVL